MAAQLSPAMLGALRATAAGFKIDGRSWRAFDAIRRRGLIELNEATVWVPTESGRATIAAAEAAGE